MSRFWKIGVLLAAPLALGAVAAGIVAAQTGGKSTPSGTSTATEQNGTAAAPSSTPGSSNATPNAKKQQLIDDFLNKLAANLGVSLDQLKQALTTTEQQMLDQAVADGKLTQSEADKIKSKIENGDFSHLFPFAGHGRGHGFKNGFARGFLFGMGEGDLVKQTADFLGIDRQAVIDGLNNNESLAQIAQDHGKTADDLANYINTQLKSSLDQAVKDNKITQSREDSILSNAKDRINTTINRAGGAKDHGDGNTPSSTPSGTANPANPTSL